MENDDRQIGRILNRREVLALLGTGGAAILLGSGFQTVTDANNIYLPLIMKADAAITATPTATLVPTTSATAVPTTIVTPLPTVVPACVVRPAKTEGPYFVDEKINRSDIRTDTTTNIARAGALLALTFNVSQINNAGCTAFTGATIDIWHCDAAGAYSDVSDAGFNTVGQNWLRGYQVTDANGQVTFTTIYPGWYSGRAVHIHFKIRATTAANQRYEFTSQLFFDDAFSDQVFTQTPYVSKGQRNTLNSNDNIYSSQLLLTVNPTAQGYAAAFEIGLNLA